MKALAKTLITTAAAGTFAAAISSAHAGSVTQVTAKAPRDAAAVTVNFEDIDLHSARGQETLHYRLSRAAEEVCGSSNLRETGSLAQAARNAECQETALERALSKVNAAAVATTY